MLFPRDAAVLPAWGTVAEAFSHVTFHITITRLVPIYKKNAQAGNFFAAKLTQHVGGKRVPEYITCR